MEVLKSDDKLREEILNDAKIKAERILKKADGEIKELEEKMKKEIEKFERENKANIEKFIEEEKNKIFASVDIDFKKKSLKIIGNIIDEVFEELKNKIINDKEMYKNLIRKLIINAFEILNSSEYEVNINEKEVKYLEITNFKDFLQDYGLKLKENKFNIKINQEKNLKGIIIYNSDKTKQVFISLEKFISDLKEAERLNVYNIIFNRGQ